MHLNYFEFYKLVRVLMDWKLIARKWIKKRRDYKTKISDHPYPHQEGSVECGFFVLGFMREMVLNELDVLESKEFYTCDDMDLIRGKWTKFVMQFIKYDM